MRKYQMTHNGELPASMESPGATGSRSPDRRDSFIDDIPQFPGAPFVTGTVDDSRDRLAEQVSALREMTLQNQLAIERILKILEITPTANREDGATKPDHSGSTAAKAINIEQNADQNTISEPVDKEFI
jgi:hypothetical protein